jgi:hypothetical protein
MYADCFMAFVTNFKYFTYLENEATKKAIFIALCEDYELIIKRN